MPLESPNLDDRTWQQLVESATARIRQDAPDWTDLSPSDPGIVLLELFAFLTEALIYRLNRVPDKLYIEFLRLIGVRLQPPAAAAVDLVFSREEGVHGPIEIPRGTHVTVARPVSGSEPPMFLTAETATLSAADDTATVRAYHAELIEAESLGTATGDPGLRRTVARPPIVAPTGRRARCRRCHRGCAGRARRRRPRHRIRRQDVPGLARRRQLHPARARCLRVHGRPGRRDGAVRAGGADAGSMRTARSSMTRARPWPPSRRAAVISASGTAAAADPKATSRPTC